MKNNIINHKKKISEAIFKLNSLSNKILIVLNDKKYVIGVVTEGDINFYLEKGISLSEKIHKATNRKFSYVSSKKQLLNFFLNGLNHKFLHIPLIKKKKLIKIFFYKDVLNYVSKKLKKQNFKVLIMAGGFGKRMGDISKKIPKPIILDKNKKPLLVNAISFFRKLSDDEIFISLFHKKNLIKKIIKKHSIDNLNFIDEEKPLGTIGSLSKINLDSGENIMIVNCDTKFNINPNIFVNYHILKKCDLTIVASFIKEKLNYGVLTTKSNNNLKYFREKPNKNYLINLGIYVANNKVQKLIPKDKKFDANQLINACLKYNLKVKVFPIQYKLWKDLGTKEKYLNYINKH